MLEALGHLKRLAGAHFKLLSGSIRMDQFHANPAGLDKKGLVLDAVTVKGTSPSLLQDQELAAVPVVVVDPQFLPPSLRYAVDIRRQNSIGAGHGGYASAEPTDRTRVGALS